MRAALAMALLLAGPACASGTIWHRVGDVPGYPGMRQELQAVTDKTATQKTNHFCVIVADDPAAARDPQSVARLAYVHWREGHYLFAYAPTDQPQIDSASIWGAASFDIAERPPGISQAFVRRIIETCRRKGDAFVVDKRNG